MSLSFVHCQCPHFILPSANLKPVSVKRELTFLEVYKWVEQEGNSPPGTLTDGVRAPGENIPAHRQGSQQNVIWNLLILCFVPALGLTDVKEVMGPRCSGDLPHTALILCLLANKYCHLLIN